MPQSPVLNKASAYESEYHKESCAFFFVDSCYPEKQIRTTISAILATKISQVPQNLGKMIFPYGWDILSGITDRIVINYIFSNPYGKDHIQ